MSTDSPSGLPDSPAAYTVGTDRYTRWILDFLGMMLANAQEEISEAVATDSKVVIVGANGFGKSYVVAALALAFLLTNLDSNVILTSGSYAQMQRTTWRPIKNMHSAAQENYGIPGRTKDSPRPKIDFDHDDEWYFEAARPTDSGELEGAHNDSILAIVEEADKDVVDHDVIDSMESLVTDSNDRIVVVANPPKTENNVVYDLMEDPTWTTLQYSSFESHNIEHGYEQGDDGYIPGMTTLSKVQDNWESWNEEPWPGLEEAKQSGSRDDLDVRWYRRRLGIMPPSGAEAHRPIYLEDVQDAVTSSVTPVGTPDVIAVDIARAGGDSTAIAKIYGNVITVEHFTVSNHTENDRRVREALHDYGPGTWLTIDAIGEGSDIADRLKQEYPRVIRFDAGSNADDEDEYENCRTEGLARLGQWLKQDAQIANDRLRKELFEAARSVEYNERSLRGGTVLLASPKEDLKKRLGRSPDCLDAAMMAAWTLEHQTTRTIASTWAT